ncbi:hypothetical protein [Tenacibaculum amylolyticum]|uniref:hypothetical protein n=1 Tax=Tenacibaculum amylolyticum TaxID=104269 RepID=UPI003895794B
MKAKIKIALIAIIGMSLGIKSQEWNTVDVGNAPELTLFKHTGSSTPVPFNLQKFGYSGSNINYGLLHLDMGHNIIGGGSNLHFRLKNSSNSFKEYGGFGSFIINNASGNEDGGLTFYTTNNGKTRIRRMTILNNGFVGMGTNTPQRSLHVVSSSWDNTYGAGAIFENDNSVGSGITLKPTGSQVSNGTLGWSIYAGGPGSAIKDGNLGFWAHGTNAALMSIKRSGEVGVGTNTPSEKLDVSGNVKITGDLKMSGPDSYIWTNGTGTGYTGIYDPKNNRVLLYTSESTGNVGIGTTDTKGFKLGVNGKVAATEVKVATYSNWADFVFKKNYELPTLTEVENHIKENGHLKDIPSADEVAENGFFLGEMDAKLLQKIEELTLYTIEQEKKIKSLEKQLTEIEELKKQNSEIKNLVQKLLKEKN